jgi:hypothetical protein
MRRNDFINNLIELSKKTYYNKEDLEDLDDIVYDILKNIDKELIKKCVDDLGRDYLIDMCYHDDDGDYSNLFYDDSDLISYLIQDIWDKEDIYSYFD